MRGEGDERTDDLASTTMTVDREKAMNEQAKLTNSVALTVEPDPEKEGAGAGWQKPVAPPPEGSRPGGLPPRPDLARLAAVEAERDRLRELVSALDELVAWTSRGQMLQGTEDARRKVRSARR